MMVINCRHPFLSEKPFPLQINGQLLIIGPYIKISHSQMYRVMWRGELLFLTLFSVTLDLGFYITFAICVER